MNKNVCIVHFNTPVLTAHLVKSINKHTPGTHIYIFDNSDKRPFINDFYNVTVFDNTKGQIINFDQWLKKYPNKDKSGGKANKWGSAKHAYSVEKCMELIGESFVLFDSDVLVKNDFSSFYDEIVCYKGEVINQPGTNNKIKRVLPFICFINTPMCLEKNIHYFDENYMHGLRVGQTGDRYDTGAALYLLTEKYKGAHREIKVSDYIVHYGNGSWVDAAEKIKKPKHIPAGDWLKKYKEFWVTENETNKELNLGFHDSFDHIYCIHYLPENERLAKLTEELWRVGIDVTSSDFSWRYYYPDRLLDLIYDDKRVNMCQAIKASSRDCIKRLSVKHYEIIKEAYSLGYERILIMEDTVRFHKDLNYIHMLLNNVPDTDVVMFDKMVSSGDAEAIKYKRYLKQIPDDSLYGNMKDSGVFFIFSSCYSLNKVAMEKIMKLQENGLLPADTPLNDKTLSGSFAIVNLAIQSPAYQTRDNENYKKIGLDTSRYQIDVDKPEPSLVRKSVPKPRKMLTPKKSQTKIKEEIKTLKKGSEKISQTIKNVDMKTKKSIIPDKANRVVVKRISANASCHNKLYDVY